jgi:SM-20-related protein
MAASDVFDMDAFNATPLNHDPYDYLIIDKFVKPDALTRINADYPKIDDVGSLPIAGLKFGPDFQAMVDALESEEFRKAFEKKFSIDLTDRPSTITVRGRCGTRDGNIHTDSNSKIITVLLYLNNNCDCCAPAITLKIMPPRFRLWAERFWPFCGPKSPGTAISRSLASDG